MSSAAVPASKRPIFDRPLRIVRPSFPDPSRFAKAFEAALASGMVTNHSPWVVEFERQLTDYLGTPTIVFANGQMALMAMLRAAGIEGGEVIVPSFTFAATPHAVRWVGAEPVFADIRGDGSMVLDPADVEARITAKTVAILGVDAYGIACDYDALAGIGRKHGLKVLYDSAPSFGTQVGGRRVGGFGDAQIFSFHATKPFATMEGGALSTNDPELMARARAIRNFGQTSDGDCDEAGFNGKMTEICALIGIEQLRSFDAAIETRARSVARLRAGLEAIDGLTVASAPADQAPVWLYLPVLVDAAAFGMDRDALAAALEQDNLFVRKYYSPACHKMTAYRAHHDLVLPVTERAAAQVIALPLYNDMTLSECDGIVQAIEGARSRGLKAARQAAQ